MASKKKKKTAKTKAPVAKKAKKNCTVCRKPGHNKRTCPKGKFG